MPHLSRESAGCLLEILEPRQFLSTTTVSPSIAKPLFKLPKLYPTSTTSNGAQLITGDFNGDSKLDIATLLASGVGVKLGDGKGGFGKITSTSITSGFASNFAAGKFNADASADIVVVGTAGAFILLASGAGSFSVSALDLGAGQKGITVKTADFDGDKKIDIAAGCTSDVRILLGNGNGTFGAAKIPFTGGHNHIVSLGDFNNDKQIDVVETFQGANNFQWLLNTGGGNFAKATSTTASFAGDLVTADFNGDKKLDTAFVELFGQTVTMILGDGKGGIKKRVVVPKTLGANRLVAQDVSRDGKADLILISNIKAVTLVINVLLGTGKGPFAKPITLPVKNNPQSVLFGLFNADKKIDGVAGFIGKIGILLGP